MTDGTTPNPKTNGPTHSFYVWNRHSAAFDLLAEYGFPSGVGTQTYSRRADADTLAWYPERAVLLHAAPFDPIPRGNRKRPLPGWLIIAHRQRDPLEVLGWRAEHYSIPDEYAARAIGMDLAVFRDTLEEVMRGTDADRNTFALNILKGAATVDFWAASVLRGLYLPDLSEVDVMMRAEFVPA